MKSDDLISRSALVEEFEWLKMTVGSVSVSDIDDAIERIKNAPAVDAEPVRHGRWYDKGVPGYPHMHDWRCSICEQTKSVNHIGPKDNYCPNCGAKMDSTT